MCPRGRKVRPVLGRLRESLFSALGSLEGMVVLDLFAGTGSLGFESISRGARFATFVENDEAALRCLRKNVISLDLQDIVEVCPLDVHDWLGESAGEGYSFPIIFADPPYGVGEIGLLMGRLGDLPLADDSLLIIKHEVGEDPAVCSPMIPRIKVLRRGTDRITILRAGGGD